MLRTRTKGRTAGTRGNVGFRCSGTIVSGNSKASWDFIAPAVTKRKLSYHTDNRRKNNNTNTMGPYEEYKAYNNKNRDPYGGQGDRPATRIGKGNRWLIEDQLDWGTGRGRDPRG